MTDKANKIKVEIIGSVYDGTKYLKGVIELPENQALSLIASNHAKPFNEPEELIPDESENKNPEDSENPTSEDEELPNTDINKVAEEPEPELSEEKEQNQQSKRFGRRNK